MDRVGDPLKNTRSLSAFAVRLLRQIRQNLSQQYAITRLHTMMALLTSFRCEMLQQVSSALSHFRLKHLADANAAKRALQPTEELYFEVLQHWCVARDSVRQLQGRGNLLTVRILREQKLPEVYE